MFLPFLHKGNNSNGVRLGKEKEREKKGLGGNTKVGELLLVSVSVFFPETQVFSVIVIFAAELSDKGGGRGGGRRGRRRHGGGEGRRRRWWANRNYHE